MYSNFSNCGKDSFPFQAGAFHPASARDGDVTNGGERLSGIYSASSGSGILAWVKKILRR